MSIIKFTRSVKRGNEAVRGPYSRTQNRPAASAAAARITGRDSQLPRRLLSRLVLVVLRLHDQFVLELVDLRGVSRLECLQLVDVPLLVAALLEERRRAHLVPEPRLC